MLCLFLHWYSWNSSVKEAGENLSNFCNLKQEIVIKIEKHKKRLNLMLGFWLQDITNWVYPIYSQVSVICFKNFLMMFSNFILRWFQCEDINKAWYDLEVLSAPWKVISNLKNKNKKNTFALEICLQLVISWVSLLKVSCWHIWTLDPGKSSSYLLRSQVTDASKPAR